MHLTQSTQPSMQLPMMGSSMILNFLAFVRFSAPIYCMPEKIHITNVIKKTAILLTLHVHTHTHSLSLYESCWMPIYLISMYFVMGNRR